jgi:hypothetical protein
VSSRSSSGYCAGSLTNISKLSLAAIGKSEIPPQDRVGNCRAIV